MLDYSELTVVKNAEGLPTALGYPVHSLLLQNNKPLFMTGGKKNATSSSHDEFEHLAIPAGLVCMTETICTRPESVNATIYRKSGEELNSYEMETIPEGLYEKLLALAEMKQPKKLSRTKNVKKNKTRKNKTHKRKG